MDTTVSLRASGKEAKEAVDEGFDRLDQLDKLAGQNEDSDVSRINAAAGSERNTQYIFLSRLLTFCVMISRE